MKNLVIIKLYRNDYESGDLHDLLIEKTEECVKKLKAEAEKFNKRLLFTCIQNVDICNFDCFAEIDYTETLNEEEKEIYISLLKVFTTDAEIKSKSLNEYQILKTIILKKIDIDEIINFD